METIQLFTWNWNPWIDSIIQGDDRWYMLSGKGQFLKLWFIVSWYFTTFWWLRLRYLSTVKAFNMNGSHIWKLLMYRWYSHLSNCLIAPNRPERDRFNNRSGLLIVPSAIIIKNSMYKNTGPELMLRVSHRYTPITIIIIQTTLTFIVQ